MTLTMRVGPSVNNRDRAITTPTRLLAFWAM